MTAPFLPLRVVLGLEPLARALRVSPVARSARGFVRAYEAAGGKPAALSPYWVQRRAAFIARHEAQLQRRGEALFQADGLPTRRVLALAMWAYSPSPARGRITALTSRVTGKRRAP